MRQYTFVCTFRKIFFWDEGFLNFADFDCFFLQKISVFWPKQYICLKQQCESWIRNFSVLFSDFLRQRVTFNQNVSFSDYQARIRPPDYSKLAANLKNDNNVTTSRRGAIKIKYSISKYLKFKIFCMLIPTSKQLELLPIRKPS